MRRAPLIAGSLAAIYFLLAFNAYACLIPMYGGVKASQGSDCSMPQEQPARQQCDTFKTVGAQSLSSFQPLLNVHAQPCLAGLVPVPALPGSRISSFETSESPPHSSQDILDLTSVLRI